MKRRLIEQKPPPAITWMSPFGDKRFQWSPTILILLRRIKDSRLFNGAVLFLVFIFFLHYLSFSTSQLRPLASEYLTGDIALSESCKALHYPSAEVTDPTNEISETTFTPEPETTSNAEPAYDCPAFVINPRQVCSNKSPLLIMLITSNPANLQRRLLIRRAWAHPKFTSQWETKAVFILGTPLSHKEHNAVKYENDLYRDIVQGDFIDSYYNLTYKTLAGLRWASHFCRSATYALKVDDDVFVDIFTLLPMLERMKVGYDTSKVLMCHVSYKAGVYRRGKYSISMNEYAGKYYPPFCLGPAYLMSLDVVQDLTRESRNTPIFKLEDVYTTGFVAQRIGVKHRQFVKAYAVGNKETKLRHFYLKLNGKIIFSHFMTLPLRIVNEVWSEMVSLRTLQEKEEQQKIMGLSRYAQRSDLAMLLEYSSQREYAYIALSATNKVAVSTKTVFIMLVIILNWK